MLMDNNSGYKHFIFKNSVFLSLYNLILECSNIYSAFCKFRDPWFNIH